MLKSIFRQEGKTKISIIAGQRKKLDSVRKIKEEVSTFDICSYILFVFGREW